MLVVGRRAVDRGAAARCRCWRRRGSLAAGTPAASRFESSVVHRPRLRRAAMQWVIRYPERLSVPLAQELVLSFGKPGFVDGLRAIFDYSYRDRLPEIEIPVLIVWGQQRPARARSATRSGTRG